ncbi:MAG: Zinc transporter ZupT [Saezia sanguinis]
MTENKRSPFLYVDPALFILCVVTVLVGYKAWGYFHIQNPMVANALLGGAVAAFGTAIGTLPVLLARSLSVRTQDTMLGFAAGVMLAACSFSLIIPGIDAARSQGVGAWGSGFIVAGSIMLGAGLMFLIERFVPHEHFIKGVEGQQALLIRRTWLFVFAIALHNVPEGLAIGVGFGGTDQLRASALAAGIAIQDIPEGLVVAVALVGAGYKRSSAVLLGIVSGLIEPIAAVLGALVINLSTILLPWGLGFAAGAMLFVVSHEMIPESHRKGHEAYATGGLIIGFVIMMLLDTVLA